MQRPEFYHHETVDKHLVMHKLLPATRKALMEFSSKETEHPRRTVLWMKQNRRNYVMPSYSAWEKLLATKIIVTFPDCAEKGLPVRHSYVLLFDDDDGALKCIMEAEPITLKRTAASSVVATQAIIRKEPKIFGVLGSGNHAAAHILAFNEIYDFEMIKVWGRTPENVAKLAALLKDVVAVTTCSTAEEAVRDADIVVTATMTTKPVLKGKWLKSGCHVNAIGALRSTWRELDDDCMKDAVVYTDSIETAENESGDVILSKMIA